MSTTAHHCASVSSQNGALVTIAALLTRMSSLPNSASTAATASATDAGSRTSATIGSARPPAAVTAPTTASSSARVPRE